MEMRQIKLTIGETSSDETVDAGDGDSVARERSVIQSPDKTEKEQLTRRGMNRDHSEQAGLAPRPRDLREESLQACR